MGLRGVILAGGTGSRLSPHTRTVNKHMVRVGRVPMIYYPIRQLISMGASEILIVTGTEHAGSVFQHLGSGEEFGVNFTYRVQEKASGIADALRLAQGFVDGDPFCMMLGDNVFAGPLIGHARDFHERVYLPGGRARGMVILCRVPDAHRFGVAVLNIDGGIDRIIEKPDPPSPSDLAVTGCYFYAGADLFDLAASLQPSARGEVEITDLNNELLRRGRLSHAIYTGEWSDAGTHESLERAEEIVRRSL